MNNERIDNKYNVKQTKTNRNILINVNTKY